MRSKSFLAFVSLFLFLFSILYSCRKEEIKKNIKITTDEVISVLVKRVTVKGTIVDIGEGINEYGHVWSTSKIINIDDPYTINHGERVNTGSYKSEFTDLSPNTTYNIWAYASDGKIAVTGKMLSFTTKAQTLATVITGAVNEISQTSVQITGILSDFGNGIDSVQQHGHCWSTNQNPTIDDNKTELGSKSTTVEFTSVLTGLERGTIYYVRAYTTTSVGTAYGNEIHFTKLAKAPSIETIDVSLIAETSAKSGGNITYDGEYAIITRGVCWNTSQNPTILDNYTSDGDGTGIFTSSITGLVRGTIYYIRAYATNSICIAYGNEISFKTLDIPTVNTNPVNNVTSTTAETDGMVADNGGTPVTIRGVCWSTSHNPTIADEHTTDGMGTGYYTSFITNLSPEKTYYVRAYATNSVGTAYGNEISFTTNATVLTVTTISASSITENSAESGGNITDDGDAIVTARGVCWSTSQNPTILDNHTTDGIGTGRFSSSITGLSPVTTYYVRAYATNSIGTAYGNEIGFTTLYETGTVTDYNGNEYNTVRIGNQWWMAENLKTTHYANGDAIPDGTGAGDISGETEPKYWFAYDDDLDNVSTYGRLYTWYAVTDSRNVCPDGWHVPGYAEWAVLIDILCGTNVAGGKLKETGTDHWNSPNTGATNENGFSALPGGYRYGNDNYLNMGDCAYFWSSAEHQSYYARYRLLLYYSSVVYRYITIKEGGFSVRCVRDSK